MKYFDMLLDGFLEFVILTAAIALAIILTGNDRGEIAPAPLPTACRCATRCLAPGLGLGN